MEVSAISQAADEDKTREQLIQELVEARLEIDALRSRSAGGAALDDSRAQGRSDEESAATAEIRAIVDALPDLVIRIRRDGVFQDVKSPAQDVLSRPAEKIVGFNIRDTGLPDDVVAIHLEKIEAALRSRQVETFEYQLEVPRGRRDFEGRATATSDDEVMLLIRDVSESKQALEQRRQLEHKLQHARRMESIGRLAGGVAHNLNNLLSPIFGYAEMLLVDRPSLERRQDYLKTILKAANGARSLTRQLLAISHKQIPEIRRIDLCKVVGDFEKILRRGIREDIEVEIRQTDEPVIIEADISQVEQVILNLALNAQDAMPNSGRLVIETRHLMVANGHRDLEPGDYGLLRVSDTGTGIDSDIREQIFEPFFTTKDPGRGTGLGLSTVHAIVKQHGGGIHVDSVVSAGTTFEIFFPLGEGEHDGTVEISRARPPLPRSGRETVLVAEDDDMVNRLVCRILRKHGYRVLGIGGGESSLFLVRRQPRPIDLLVTDVVMPGMSGPELYQQLHSTLPDLKVLYMSGYADEVLAKHGVRRSSVHFVRKPFSIPGLLHKVREALDNGGMADCGDLVD